MTITRRRMVSRSTALAAILWTGAAIDWGDTTYSTSFEEPYTAVVGEILTINIPEGELVNIDFESEPSDHFAVSYRQCTGQPAQPLQIQYAEKLQHTAYPGGCLYAENEVAQIGPFGCTFWQYNPSENWATDGVVKETSDPIEPGRVRLDNRGNANATVDVVMFSTEVPVPEGIVDSNVYVDEIFSKQDRIVNTSLSVYLNNDESHCVQYGCVVTGYINDHVEGQDAVSLCDVVNNGKIWVEAEPFDTFVPMTFELPEDGEYYVSIVLSAMEHRSANITRMQEFGLDKVIVFQTDTTLPDSSARLVAGASLLTLAWLVLVNAALAIMGSDTMRGVQNAVPTLGW